MNLKNSIKKEQKEKQSQPAKPLTRVMKLW
jgi:hypothetical protein